MTFTAEDRTFMMKAIALGQLDKRIFHVGVVITKDGMILAEAHGAEDVEQTKHAELSAIGKCLSEGKSPNGATLYTTLEPCIADVRSPNVLPCAQAILNYGIARVVIGLTDPNPDVYRKGIQVLERKNLVVDLCTDNDLHKQMRDQCDVFLRKHWARYHHYSAFELNKNFGGRGREREMLTSWLCRSGKYMGKSLGDKAILVYHAIGGMGKTNLSWLWTTRDVAHHEVTVAPDSEEVRSRCRVPDGWQLPLRIMWFSFYSHEGGGDYYKFLEQAIEHFSAGTRRPVDYVVNGQIDYVQLADDLIDILKQSRCLLVWDGAERLLREYGGIDPFIAEQRSVEQILDDPAALRCSDLSVSQFLWRVASQTNSKMLIMSRLPFGDLQNSAGAEQIELDGLDSASAVKFLKDRGIRGLDSMIEEKAGWFGFHPLSLNNLVSALADDFDEPGDIDAPFPMDLGMPMDQRRNHVLALAYGRRAPHRQELLSRLAAIRTVIPKHIVRLLANDILRPVTDTIGGDISELIRHGLLNLRKDKQSYNLHPVVRHYAYTRLSNKEEIHRRLRDCFRPLALSIDSDKVENFDDLLFFVEFYYHMAKAGERKDAISYYYYYKLGRADFALILFDKLSKCHATIELLELVRPPDHDNDGLPSAIDSEDAIVLRDLAYAHQQIGNIRRASELCNVIIKNTKRPSEYSLAVTRAVEGLTYKEAYANDMGSKHMVATAYQHLGRCELLLGHLKAAEQHLVESIDLFCSIDEPLGMRVSMTLRACKFGYCGRFELAKPLLYQALSTVHEENLFTLLSLAQMNLLMNAPQEAGAYAALAAKIVSSIDGKFYMRSMIELHYFLGATELALGRIQSSERSLSNALHDCRKAGDIVTEGKILLELGKVLTARSMGSKSRQERMNLDLQAHQFYCDALAIARRCGLLLLESDVQNSLAGLSLTSGDYEICRAYAESAMTCAMCGVDPNVSTDYYVPAYQEATRLLAQCPPRMTL